MKQEKEEWNQEEIPKEHHVIVGKRLIKFSDLRKPIIYFCFFTNIVQILIQFNPKERLSKRTDSK